MEPRRKKGRERQVDAKKWRRERFRDVLSRESREVLLRGGKNMDLNLGLAAY